MRTRGGITFAASALVAVAVLAAPAAAQSSSPTGAEVNRAKAALVKYVKEHAPKSEAKPTALSSCPFGDLSVAALAKAQADYDATAGEPVVQATVFVDQTIDKGTRSIACTAQYTDRDGASQPLSVVAYADPGLETPAFAKALAKETKGKVVANDPPSPSLAGGKVEGYCVKYSGSQQCSYVWSRNGLYVEMDSAVPRAKNFNALRSLVLEAIATLPDASVGVG